MTFVRQEWLHGSLVEGGKKTQDSFQEPTMTASMHGVTKNYGSRTALKSFDLSLEGGKILALLGANGAGKTTVVKLMLGLLKPTHGEVNGSVQCCRRRACRRHCA
jgi:Cu-processing system ATP-binding protein